MKEHRQGIWEAQNGDRFHLLELDAGLFLPTNMPTPDNMSVMEGIAVRYRHEDLHRYMDQHRNWKQMFGIMGERAFQKGSPIVKSLKWLEPITEEEVAT